MTSGQGHAPQDDPRGIHTGQPSGHIHCRVVVTDLAGKRHVLPGKAVRRTEAAVVECECVHAGLGQARGERLQPRVLGPAHSVGHDHYRRRILDGLRPIQPCFTVDSMAIESNTLPVHATLPARARPRGSSLVLMSCS
ncbi:Uncharacterised protein [Mycobacteroides abscessus subsp. abscessus]|nr:Uncharacterised protein [Mycobacteroides abscessus subsp. abscessus]